MKHTQVTREGQVFKAPLAQLTYGALLQGRTAMVADAGEWWSLLIMRGRQLIVLLDSQRLEEGAHYRRSLRGRSSPVQGRPQRGQSSQASPQSELS